MIAVTVRPPWSQIIAETAALTALGVAPKSIENRGRKVADRHIGADIAIHAGRKWDPDGANDLRVRAAWRVFAEAIDLRKPNPLLAAIGDTRTGYVGGLRVPSLWIDQGVVVAVATLVDCHPAIQIPDLGVHPARSCCLPYGEPFHNGNPAYHLVLGNVRRLRTPVEASGCLAVPWNLPAAAAVAVQLQLAAMAAS